MFNLLPEKEKTNILREYKLRRLVVVAIFLFALGFISSIFLFPSFLLSSVKVSELEAEVGNIHSSVIFQETTRLEELMEDARKKLNAIKPRSDVLPSELIGKITESRGGNIRITGIQYKVLSGKNPETISVSGVARNRDSLLKFVKALEAEEMFDSVDLPVSNFAQDRDAVFALKITIATPQ